jgi:hypothetical protein
MTTISVMFGNGPTTLEKVCNVAKRPMQELYSIVVFMLKYRLLAEMKTYLCLRLPSEAVDINKLQRKVLCKLYPAQVLSEEPIEYRKVDGHSIEQFL